MDKESKARYLDRFLTREFLQGFAAVIFFGTTMYLGSRFIGTENIREKVSSAGILGPLIFILIKSSTIIFAPLGGNPLYLAAGPLFGYTHGFIYLFLGDLIGYSAVFWISKIFGRKVLRKLLDEKQLQKADSILHRVGTWQGLTLARIVFFGFADAISYTAGLTPIPFWQYSLVTLPMIVISIAFLMVVGHTFITNNFSYIFIVSLFATVPVIFLLLRYLWKKTKQ